ncbi:MAG: DUF2156 domain-containing protein [Clostridia bacterium]|nr:DUF2156 domain-containing protein [Clostridia bacterium]
MIDFQKVSLKEIPRLQEFFLKNKSRLCDRSLGGAVMWRESFDTSYAVVDDILFFRSKIAPGKFAYTPPLGDLKKGIQLLLEHCENLGEKLVFCSVGESEKDAILEILPSFSAEETRDWFDYLYFAENLKTMAGKKLAGQRNHRNFFLKTYTDWQFEEISEKNVFEVSAFLDKYLADIQKDSSYFRDEEKAVRDVLSHLGDYGFMGGLIRVEGEVCAFSFAEIIGDTMFIHIEKADRNVRGAYQMILSQMITHFATENVVYVNREEDVGDPGLRYSKEAYHPCKLLKKYVVCQSEN